MTRLRDLLAQGAATLTAADVPGAERDAQRLFADLMGWQPSRLALELDDPVPEDIAAAFHSRIAARAAGRPVSKITGWRDFWAHRFIVTDDVLDPRPDTETLVAKALSAPFARVLDLGTGSGCIVISLLAERAQARGLGADLSPAALQVAARNATAIGVADRLDLIPSDWFSAIDGQFDLIVSNPPYIAADEIQGLAPEVRLHDPEMALTDGADGLSAYRILAAQAGAHLLPKGRLMVEIGPTQGVAVADLFRAAGFADVTITPDLDGRDRVVCGIWPGAAL